MAGNMNIVALEHRLLAGAAHGRDEQAEPRVLSRVDPGGRPQQQEVATEWDVEPEAARAVTMATLR